MRSAIGLAAGYRFRSNCGSFAILVFARHRSLVNLRTGILYGRGGCGAGLLANDI